jgi:hypothetical protein
LLIAAGGERSKNRYRCRAAATSNGLSIGAGTTPDQSKVKQTILRYWLIPVSSSS